ncbi:MAG TPA: dihydrofolate reductase family protein [Gemmatimonadaceae bacterium]|nr:dihydrofolate reductase family protein [Gemmatimonadaceae bacterium]
MRKLIVSTLVTLDNVIEDPGGMAGFTYGGWADAYFNEEAVARSIRKLQECDYFLCGRRTYEMFSRVWSKSSNPYADRLNSMPKLVASRTLTEPLTWNAQLLHGDAIEALKTFKQEPGKNILMYGSARFMHALLQRNMVDQLDLLLCPITLGTGQRLFDEAQGAGKFELLDQTRLSSGMTILSYRPLS